MATFMTIMACLAGVAMAVCVPRLLCALLVGLHLGGWWWVLLGPAAIIGLVMDIFSGKTFAESR